jgi:hypothetical protein
MNGFRMHLLNGLVSDGLATMQETARAGGTKVVTRFRITDAGRRVLGIPTD